MMRSLLPMFAVGPPCLYPAKVAPGWAVVAVGLNDGAESALLPSGLATGRPQESKRLS
jgi:hypothetical protein